MASVLGLKKRETSPTECFSWLLFSLYLHLIDVDTTITQTLHDTPWLWANPLTAPK